MFLPPSAGELGVIFLPSKIHLDTINTFSCVGPSWTCVSVFMLLSFHISCFYFSFVFIYLCINILVLFYLFWLFHVFIFNFFLIHHSQWWRLRGQFGLGFQWCFHLGHFPVWCVLIFILLFICHLFNVFSLLRFWWWHHIPHIHVLTLSHCLCFGFPRILLWLEYLGSTQKLDTPWSFITASP